MPEKEQKPQIRFKGFTDAWEQRKLSSIATMHARIGWQNLRTSEFLDRGNYYLITGTDFIDGEIDLKTCHFVEKERYDQDKNIQIKNGSILITKDGTLGKVAYVEGLDKPATLNAGVFNVVIIDKNMENKYLFHYLKAPFLMDYVGKRATGGTIKHLNQNILVDFPVIHPSYDEQTKIGAFFSKLDNLITLHQRKYEKLLTMKKSCLEKMFPKNENKIPEIRFKGFTDAWEQRKFGDCVLIQRGGSPRPIESYITEEENGINWVKIGDVSADSRYITKTKEKIIPEGEKFSRRVQIGDLILSNSMSFGRPYIMAVNGCIHDGWLLIRDNKNLFDTEYLLQLLSSNNMYFQYKSLASGGVVNNLNSELVQSTTALIPPKEEQIKIGKYFAKLDNLITLHQRKVKMLQNIKKSCLEKMFL